MKSRVIKFLLSLRQIQKITPFCCLTKIEALSTTFKSTFTWMHSGPIAAPGAVKGFEKCSPFDANGAVLYPGHIVSCFKVFSSLRTWPLLLNLCTQCFKIFSSRNQCKIVVALIRRVLRLFSRCLELRANSPKLLERLPIRESQNKQKNSLGNLNISRCEIFSLK